MSVQVDMVGAMAKTRTVLACRECSHQVSQWVGRCPGCNAWGTIEAVAGAANGSGASPSSSVPLSAAPDETGRESTRASQVSTVCWVVVWCRVRSCCCPANQGSASPRCCLHLVASLGATGRACLLVSGEESHAQISARAHRLGLAADTVSFAPGRELDEVLQLASGGTALPARGRFDPDPARSIGYADAWRGLPGATVHRRLGRAWPSRRASWWS